MDVLLGVGALLIIPLLLLAWVAAEVALSREGSADCAAGQSVALQLLGDGGRVDQIRVFRSDFDAIEAPFFDGSDPLDLVRGEGRGQNEGVDAETHGRGPESNEGRSIADFRLPSLQRLIVFV